MGRSNFEFAGGPQDPGLPGNVDSVNGRTGAVTLTKSDVALANADNTSDANKPVSTAQAAAIAAAQAASQPADSDLTAIAALATTPYGRALLTAANLAALVALGIAPLDSPALTTNPTAPTQTAGNNSTRIANTAFVAQALADLVASAPGTLDTLNELAAALGNDPNFATTIATSLGGKQPLDGTLTALAGVSTAADKLPYFTGNDTSTVTDLTATGRSVIGAASAGAIRTFLALVIGTDVQAHDADLDALAGLTSAANKLPYFTGSGAASVADLTAFARTILDDPDAATVLATLGVATAALTMTNKRVPPRAYSVASTATLTPEIDTYDLFHVTAQAAAITIANHSTSTPGDGEVIKIRLLDNGTARAITYGTNYVAKGGQPLPSTTVLGKNLELGFEWNANLGKYNLLGIAQEA